MTEQVIGLDPGVNTGYAVWDRKQGRFLRVESMPIHEAMDAVRATHAAGLLHSVDFEDARLRTWFGKADAREARSGAGIREGVGSVKRDCGIWAEFLTALGVTFRPRKPTAGSTKWTAEQFAKVAKWPHRTNVHGRDAALLILGR